jgi:predicted AAA+ superfamily ATPase
MLSNRQASRKKPRFQSNPAHFLVLGSAAFELVRGISETLAGRAAFVEMSGFDLDEVDSRHATALWIRGGFPRAFRATHLS